MFLTQSFTRKTIGISALFTLGIAATTAPFAGAQSLTTGTVISVNNAASACSLIVSVEGANELSALQATPEICEQLLVGQVIQYRAEITQVTTVAPPSVATVMRAQSGDRACYVDLKDENGKVTSHLSGFELCSQEGIVGATVRLTYGAGNVQSFSCQGNPDCGESDRAELITNAEIISRPQRPPISSLLDGNYRYWDGPTQSLVSSSDFSQYRGNMFLFRKQGSNITGIYGYAAGGTIDAAVCVQGQVNDDTVTGISVQSFRGAQVRSSGETFAELYPPSSSIKVRRGRQINSNTVRYSSTLLNLALLNQINAGPQIPPERC